MRYELAIFDMDGTILNTLEDLTDSVNFALSSCGYATHTLDEVKFFVGNGIRKLIERALPEGATEEEANRVYSVFMPYYKEHSSDKTKPYEGIEELIRTLRQNGVKTAVVSNKADAAVQILVEKYFNGLFDISLGENEAAGIAKKPAPAMVDMVLARLGITKDKTCFIGDSDVDLQTAINSKVDPILVEWGFRDREFLERAGASTICSSMDQVADLILTNDHPVKIVVCRHCGCEFGDNLTACPSCQSLYLPGAENEYMEKLGDLRDGIEDLGEEEAGDASAEVRKVGKLMLIALLVILAAVGLIYISIRSVSGHQGTAADAEELFAKSHEMFEHWDELYAKKDWETLVNEYFAAEGNSMPVGSYEHSDLVITLNHIFQVDVNMRELEERPNRWESGYDLYLLYDVAGVLPGNYYVDTLSEEERLVIADDLSRIEGYLDSFYHMSSEDKAAICEEIKDRRYYPYSSAEAYIDAHKGEFTAPF